MKTKIEAVDFSCSIIIYSHKAELATSFLKNVKVYFKVPSGRVYLEKPSLSIKSKFFSVSNRSFEYPANNRSISINEGADLQSFRLNYKLKTISIANADRVIGNAVPPKYTNAIVKATFQNQLND